MLTKYIASMLLPFLMQIGVDFVDRVEKLPLTTDQIETERVKYEHPVELRLDGLELNRRDWVAMTTLRRLRALSLRDTNFSDAEMVMLTHLKELRYLDLSSTLVTGGTLHRLYGLSKLQAVCMADTAVDSQAIVKLKSHFKSTYDRQLMVGSSWRGHPYARDEVSGLCCQPNQRELLVPDSIAKTADQMKPYSEVIEHTDVTMRMLPIPGGSFMMGSPATEDHRDAAEGPQRKVTISPFWMAETETTWDAFQVWTDDLDVKQRRELNLLESVRDRKADLFQIKQPEVPYYVPDMGMGFEDRPAILMTQLAARTFCQWLSAKTGRYYRLPTEAEWEYACRAGTTTAYSWGDDPKKVDQYAWHYGNTDEGDSTGRVRTKKPNPWGLYDMHGNVAEWVLDQYEPEFYKLDGPSTNPINVPQTLYPRVVRGGSYMHDPPALRSAARASSSLEWMNEEPQIPHGIWWFRGTHYWFGFRVVRPLDSPSNEERTVKWNAQQPAGRREAYLKRLERW